MISWTEERVELLRKLWLEHMSASLIARQLGGTSRSAVIGKIYRLGLCGRGQPIATVKCRRIPRPPQSQGYRPTTIGNTALKAEPVPERQAKIFEPVAVPVAKMVPFEALRQGVCKWPFGDSREGGLHFCGHDTLDGVPYCRYHTRIAYRSGR